MKLLNERSYQSAIHDECCLSDLHRTRGWDSFLKQIEFCAVYRIVVKMSEKPSYVLESKPLGRGAFGEVYKAHTSSSTVVIKRVIIPLSQRGCPPEIPINVFREMQAMIRTDHDNVVRALDVFPSGSHLCFALEPMEGDLTALLSASTPPPSECVVKAIMLRVLCGLEHLHGIGILHRVSRILPFFRVFAGKGFEMHLRRSV